MAVLQNTLSCMRNKYTNFLKTLILLKLQWQNLWGFISAAVLLTLMPGPDILFVIIQSITRGRKAGMVFAAGLCTGLIAHVTAVSLGVSILLMSSPVAFTMLKFAGAAYLLYLGVKAFLARRENHFELSGDAAVSGKLYRKGILMNILNPKVILFFLAFFPQFIDKGIENPIPQMLLLGLVFMVQAFLIFSMVAAVADRLARRLMQNPKVALAVNVAESLIYCVIGVSILFVR